VEFGAKVAGSPTNGLAFVDRIGWDNFPEAARKPAADGIMKPFLRQPAIYNTDSFRERVEARARKNLAEAVSRLRHG
jgi:predicted metal-dependent HD superfamily phosphohydrolase